MTYFKVCDTFHCHEKTEEASDSALALWVKAGSYSGQQLSDGRVPARWAHKNGSVTAAEELCDLGMWHGVGHDCPSCPSISNGYVFHEWGEHNRTRSEVEAERERWRRNKAIKRGSRMSTEESSVDSTRESPLEAPWDSSGSPGIGTGEVRDFDLKEEDESKACEHGEIRGEWACALCRRGAREAS